MQTKCEKNVKEMDPKNCLSFGRLNDITQKPSLVLVFK